MVVTGCWDRAASAEWSRDWSTAKRCGSRKAVCSSLSGVGAVVELAHFSIACTDGVPGDVSYSCCNLKSQRQVSQGSALSEAQAVSTVCKPFRSLRDADTAGGHENDHHQRGGGSGPGHGGPPGRLFHARNRAVEGAHASPAPLLSLAAAPLPVPRRGVRTWETALCRIMDVGSVVPRLASLPGRCYKLVVPEQTHQAFRLLRRC